MERTRDTLTSERRQGISQAVLERGRVTVADLAREFGVTEASIRRDLSVLEASGAIKRIHGGADREMGDRAGQGDQERMRLHLAEKDRIAQAAASLIEAGDLLVVDTGTTTHQVVKRIPPQLRSGAMLSIVTNSVRIAMEVNTWKRPNLVLLGGLYLPEYMATVGPQSIEQLGTIMADKVILGADGFTLAEGATSADVLLAELNCRMAEHGRKVILTVDSTKIGRSGFAPVVSIANLHVLITDTNAPPEFIQEVRAQGVEVILV